MVKTASPSIFLTPQWQRAWWEQFGGGDELLLWGLRRGGALVGLAPMHRRGDTIEFLGDTDLFDYHDFILGPEAREVFYPALVEFLSGLEWRTLDLRSLPAHSATLPWLQKLCGGLGYRVAVEEEDVAPGLELPPTWDQYLASLRKKDRHELRRKLRRLETAGPYRIVQGGADTLDQDADNLLRLMETSREDKRRFLTMERAEFFRRSFAAMAQLDALRLFFLELNGEPVAAVACFDYGGRRFLYNSGYDTRYSALSVGLLLKALCIKDAIERGLGYFDFLRGEESYKYHLGAQDLALRRLVVTRA
ncbi:MAG: GNAT family N-acetyltransferase [Chloroflexi bacterium]|nr:GNAT family N-acetyltransferase [Chloroflexota bacterium]